MIFGKGGVMLVPSTIVPRGQRYLREKQNGAANPNCSNHDTCFYAKEIAKLEVLVKKLCT
jgi:hypothetical protein